jgi:hypothetical protein
MRCNEDVQVFKPLVCLKIANAYAATLCARDYFVSYSPAHLVLTPAL